MCQSFSVSYGACYFEGNDRMSSRWYPQVIWRLKARALSARKHTAAGATRRASGHTRALKNNWSSWGEEGTTSPAGAAAGGFYSEIKRR